MPRRKAVASNAYCLLLNDRLESAAESFHRLFGLVVSRLACLGQGCFGLWLAARFVPGLAHWAKLALYWARDAAGTLSFTHAS